MTRALILAGVVFGFMGCAVGPSTRNFGPATGPRGIAADLRVRWGATGRLQGELLEVQDTALVLLIANRVVLVPIRVIQFGRFSRRGVLIENGKVHVRSLDRLSLVSRFPDGMKPDIMARLLAAYGQTQPDGAP